MPANFQKTIDRTLEPTNSKFILLDDRLVCTKRSLTEHEKEIDKITELLLKNLSVNLQKRQLAKNLIIWLAS